MIETHGFEGPKPFSVVVWQQGGSYQAKTVCYTQQDEHQALSRLQSVGDFYNRYDKAIVIRANDEISLHHNYELKGAV